MFRRALCFLTLAVAASASAQTGYYAAFLDLEPASNLRSYASNGDRYAFTVERPSDGKIIVFHGQLGAPNLVLTDPRPMRAFAVSTNGMVAGMVETVVGERGFIFDGSMTTLPLPPAALLPGRTITGLSISGINASRTVVGNIQTTTGSVGFYKTATGPWRTFNIPVGFDGLLPVGINDSGVMAGNLFSSTAGVAARISATGVITRLPHLSSVTSSSANGIAPDGTVFGASTSPAGNSRPTIWRPGSGITALPVPAGFPTGQALGYDATGGFTGAFMNSSGLSAAHWPNATTVVNVGAQARLAALGVSPAFSVGADAKGRHIAVSFVPGSAVVLTVLIPMN